MMFLVIEVGDIYLLLPTIYPKEEIVKSNT